ncbi:MAG TPA: DUF4956 domain-containing protein [Tepidisphaeraceae bacterium]|nr:DUF4956 domain-containing protein [Tepidisphaeraceae bacterium]
MLGFLDSLLGNDLAATLSIETALLVLVLAFVIGHLVAWVYMWTHTGVSYSRSFAGSLLVMPVLVGLVMMLMASAAVALGLLAVFAMVRFRNVLKDTRDTMFVLWAIAEGVACGTQRFGIAVLASVILGAAFLYLHFTAFGGRHRYDVVLSLEWGPTGELGRAEWTPLLRDILSRHAVRSTLASQHDLEADRMEFSYRLLLRDPGRSRELLKELQESRGVNRVSLFHRADEAEV